MKAKPKEERRKTGDDVAAADGGGKDLVADTGKGVATGDTGAAGRRARVKASKAVKAALDDNER